MEILQGNILQKTGYYRSIFELGTTGIFECELTLAYFLTILQTLVNYFLSILETLVFLFLRLVPASNRSLTEVNTSHFVGAEAGRFHSLATGFTGCLNNFGQTLRHIFQYASLKFCGEQTFYA